MKKIIVGCMIFTAMVANCMKEEEPGEKKRDRLDNIHSTDPSEEWKPSYNAEGYRNDGWPGHEEENRKTFCSRIPGKVVDGYKTFECVKDTYAIPEPAYISVTEGEPNVFYNCKFAVDQGCQGVGLVRSENDADGSPEAGAIGIFEKNGVLKIITNSNKELEDLPNLGVVAETIANVCQKGRIHRIEYKATENTGGHLTAGGLIKHIEDYFRSNAAFKDSEIVQKEYGSDYINVPGKNFLD